MIYRSRAPFRLGLAGGGTDVSPFSDKYGGYILNATIDLYARANIEPREDDKIVFRIPHLNEEYIFQAEKELEITGGNADLFKGIYNRIVKDYIGQAIPFTLTCSMDVPFGSGLGTSSTLAVAVLGAFTEWLMLPLGEYDMAYLAYQIERIDLKQQGGKQDQYAATFGGFNFMEFYGNDKVIVNPLRIANSVKNELANNLLLCYTQIKRSSSKIIAKQQRNVLENKSKSVQAMQHIKQQAKEMKEALLKRELNEMGVIFNKGWEYKKQMAEGITTSFIEETYKVALKAGSTGGKISGAGGGGYIFFYCPKNTRFDVAIALEKIGAKVQAYNFTNTGIETWKST